MSYVATGAVDKKRPLEGVQTPRHVNPSDDPRRCRRCLWGSGGICFDSYALGVCHSCNDHGTYKTLAQARGMANLRTEIQDFGGFDSSGILILRGGIQNSHDHRESPGKFASTNLSRDSLIREIGHIARMTLQTCSLGFSCL